MKKILIMLVILFISVTCAGEVTRTPEEKEEYTDFKSPYGEILGFQTDDYLFSKKGDLIGYKVRDESYIYIYTPKGDFLGYRYDVRKGKEPEHYINEPGLDIIEDFEADDWLRKEE